MPPITRREGLAALAATPARAQPIEPDLKAHAARSGRRFGSCVEWSPPGADAGSFANPAYARLLLAECNLLVPENENEMAGIAPDATSFAFAHADNLPGDASARDRAVADDSRAYLDVMLSYPQLADLLVWGMTDRYSWIEGFEPRKDGLPRRPCPFGREFKPKPMFRAMLESFAAAHVEAA
jgi:endo-1,4-beta-xylanase